MRSVLLISAWILLHAVPSGALAANVAEERPLAAGQSFHLRLEAGAVQVRPGEAGKVRVEAGLAPGQRVAWRESTDRLALIVDDPERFTARPSALSVAVPPATRLVIDLGRATLDLQGVEAERLVVRGGTEARVVGAFRAVDVAVDGPVDLRLEEPSGTVRAEGAEVQLLARGATDAVAVDARRGAASLTLDRPRRVRATSVAGPITLRLLEASGADVLLDSLSGDLRVDLSQDWSGVIVPRLGRGEIDLPDAIGAQVASAAPASVEGGRMVLQTTFGSARVRVSSPAAVAGDASAAASEADAPEE